MDTANQSDSIAASEAEHRFSELLDRVAGGTEVTITRHGFPVARIVPVRPRHTPNQRREAIDAMRKLAEGNRLEGISIRELREEGRR